MKTLSGPTKTFLDPNEIDPEGLTSLRNYSFSVEGTYCCYGLSFGGSDWSELKHEGKADGTETTTNTDQKLMYHRLGTPQSDDILFLERPDHPTWNMCV
ncbi:unnamed protein product [Schistosoma curassoni]|nr:unnamed protein product [Schistosoma curassoni]